MFFHYRKVAQKGEITVGFSRGQIPYWFFQSGIHYLLKTVLYDCGDVMSDFKLRCFVQAHASEVCALTSVVSKEGSFVAGFADSTVSLWVPKT